MAHKTDLAGHGGSRASQGPPTTEHGDSSARSNLALRQALEEIGRNERSIKPAALRAYSALIACGEVKRRMRFQSHADPSEVAHEALIDAIKSLPTERDQLIGQAVLAASADFEGDDVNTRKRTLDERHNITENVYKRYRPKVLDSIIECLDRALSEPDVSLEPLTTYYEALDEVSCIMMDVVRLSDAVRAGLFVSKFNTALHKHNLWQPSTPADRHLLTDAILNAHVELVCSTVYCFGDRSYSRRTALDKVLNPELIAELSRHLFGMLKMLWMNEHMRTKAADARSDPSLAARRHVNHMLYTSWQWHLAIDFESDSTVWWSAAFVLEVCTYLERVAYKTLAIRDNERSQITADTRATIARYYGMKESTLVGSHLTLAEHIVDYWVYGKDRGIADGWSPKLV
jgi:hypothetical protein